MKLKWSLNAKHMRPYGVLKQKLEQKVQKLETHLEHFPADAVHLLVSLERHPKKPWFAVALTLHLPSNTLRAEKFAADPIPAFDQAVKILLRELAVLKSALRRESEWNRSLRQAFLRPAGPGLYGTGAPAESAAPIAS
jgi:ribosome-associated translation inhibitor RaiA